MAGEKAYPIGGLGYSPRGIYYQKKAHELMGPKKSKLLSVEKVRGQVRCYVHSALEEANLQRNTRLRKKDSANLPADLALVLNERRGDIVSVAVLIQKFKKYMDTHLEAADADKDGFISLRDCFSMPLEIQNNFLQYLATHYGDE